MRILIYGINFRPELTGIGKYTGELADWLGTHGHAVRVVTAPPYYPQWKVGEGYSAWRYQKECLAHEVVWRCPLWVPSKPTGISRLIHLLSFSISSFLIMVSQVFWRPDVVIMIAPTLFCTPGAWLTARLSGAVAWLHIQDFELDVALGLGLLNSRLVGRIAIAFEKWVLRRFVRVSTISENMLNHLQDKGIHGVRRVLLPNWADVSKVCPGERDNSFRAELGMGPEKLLVLYAGNMGEKQGLESVLEAASQLKDQANIQFLMVGSGAARLRLERHARMLELDNLRFLPVQPLEKLPAMLAAGDIHLVVQRRDAADLVMPSKLTNILAAGRPCVATADPGTALTEVVAGHGVGLVTPPEDSVALAEAISALAADAVLREQCGRRARRYAEEFLDREAILSRFEQQLEALVDNR